MFIKKSLKAAFLAIVIVLSSCGGKGTFLIFSSLTEINLKVKRNPHVLAIFATYEENLKYRVVKGHP